jgi:hypothetical protein
MKAYKKITLMSAISFALTSANIAYADITYNTSGPVDRDMSELPPEDGGGPVWAWTNGDGGYAGNLPATWIARIQNQGGIATTETACSGLASGCGGYQLGMGARAYKDGDTNWGHFSDFGLFHLVQAATVTINVAADNSDLRPAFGLWKGWATGGSRHSAYTVNGAIDPMEDNPLGSGLTVVDTNAWAFASTQGASASATLTRYLAAGNYTLILGGYDGTTAGGNLTYSATISTSAVPLPGVAWLFGSGLVGVSALGRRKSSKSVFG